MLQVLITGISDHNCSIPGANQQTNVHITGGAHLVAILGRLQGSNAPSLHRESSATADPPRWHRLSECLSWPLCETWMWHLLGGLTTHLWLVVQCAHLEKY